jgi:hypothetical protein
MGGTDYQDQWQSLIDTGPASFKEAFPRKPFRGHQHFRRKMRPNFNDPMVLYHVLHYLVESAPGSYIRPTYLAAMLNESEPQFYWTTDIVGRILAGIWEVCWLTYLDEEDEDGMRYIATKHGPDESGYEAPIEESVRMHELPFAMGRDAKGKYYVIDPFKTYEGRFWLIKWRDMAWGWAYDAYMAEREGGLGANMWKEKTPAYAYIDPSPDPVLSAQAFRHSMVMGERSLPPRKREEDIVEVFDDLP